MQNKNRSRTQEEQWRSGSKSRCYSYARVFVLGWEEDWSGETGDERLAFESQIYSVRLHEGGEKTSASNWLTITHEAFAQISGRRKRADKKTIS